MDINQQYIFKDVIFLDGIKMQENTPQLTSQLNTDNTCIDEQSTPEVSAPSAGSKEDELNDLFHTQSLESLFEQIDENVVDSGYLLQTLRPYVFRALHNRQDSKILHEVLDFIDKKVKCSNPMSTCTWRQLYTITRLLNGNVLMIEGSEIDENENGKSELVPISDENHRSQREAVSQNQSKQVKD